MSKDLKFLTIPDYCADTTALYINNELVCDDVRNELDNILNKLGHKDIPKYELKSVCNQTGGFPCWIGDLVLV